jgi:predicted NAD/FAD-dependent oxidoreductase
MTVVVVGAGIAGLACARELVDAGIPVRVVERSATVGGRLASEWRGGRPVDVGAAYLTADDPAFRKQLRRWQAGGLCRPWTDTFRGQRGTAPMRWAAPGGLRGLAGDLARSLDITLGTEVTGLPEADAVVLAMPGPQALQIAGLPAARAQSWQPVLTAVLTYPERTWPDFAGAFVNDHPVLSTVCDDGDRRGDRAPVLVAHSTPQSATASGPAMAAAVGHLLGITAEPAVELIRWPYAQPQPRPGDFALERQEEDVYLCGDAFGKPRVQTAWLSGRAVARDIIGRQTTDR